MAPRLLDENAAATKRINFSPSTHFSLSYFAFPIVVSADPFLSSSPFVRSRFGIETTQLHSSTSRRATYADNTRGYARGARVYTRPAGNNWWYTPDQRVLHRTARRGTEKHPAAIYYRRLSIIDAGCIAVKRDSPLPYNGAPESRFFYGLLARRTLHRDIRHSRRVIK